MGGPKTAILAQVVHFYFGAVGHITIGGDKSTKQASMPRPYEYFIQNGVISN